MSYLYLNCRHIDELFMTKLLIAASGTGGHIYPALSVVEALPESWNICWLGVEDRLEQALSLIHI